MCVSRRLSPPAALEGREGPGRSAGLGTRPGSVTTAPLFNYGGTLLLETPRRARRVQAVRAGADRRKTSSGPCMA